jgi:hypothetical protein
MNLRRYVQIISRIGYVGRPLKDLEMELSREWGVSTKTVLKQKIPIFSF